MSSLTPSSPQQQLQTTQQNSPSSPSSPSSPPQQQQLSIPMERRDTGESRTSRTSNGSKRVSFLSQPSVEVKRYGSSRRGAGGGVGGSGSFFTRPTSIVRQVFVLFVLLALLLSVWYLVTSVIFKPVKEILLEELGSDGAEELLVRGQSRGNMTEVFSHAISDILGSGGGDNGTATASLETTSAKPQQFNGSYVI